MRVLSKLESLKEMITEGGHLRSQGIWDTHAIYRGGRQSSCSGHNHCPLNCVRPCKPEPRLGAGGTTGNQQEGAYAQKRYACCSREWVEPGD